MNLAQARKIFNKMAAEAAIPRHDTPMLDEAFNNWVDALEKDGQITEAQARRWTRTAG